MPSYRSLYNFDFNSALIRWGLSKYYKPGHFYTIPFGALSGIKIWYDRSINYHAMLGVWERSNFAALKYVLSKLLKDRKNIQVFDIGANIGLYSLFLAKYSKSIDVTAFEPVADTVELLRKNLQANHFDRIKVVQMAAADLDGDVTFYIGHHHKSSLEKDWTSDRGTSAVREIRISSIKLDTFVDRSTESPDFIKIDVEGGGGKVLQGASHLLETKRPVILIESHAAYEDRAIINMLKDHHYKAYRIDDGRWVKNSTNDYRDSQGVWGTMLLFPREASDYF